MNDLFGTCGPTTCAASASATSSAGFSAGRELCSLPGGPMIARSGQDLVRALPSPALDEPFDALAATRRALCRTLSELERSTASGATMSGRPTSATCGPSFTASSESVARERFSASRSRALMAGRGSTLFSLRWRCHTTPLGRTISQLQALGRRIFGRDCGGWPSPMAGMPAQKDYNAAGSTDSSRRTVELASWPTPNAAGAERGGSIDHMDGRRSNLIDTVQLTNWTTPSARDWKSSIASDETMDRNSRPLNEQARNLAGWATPAAQEAGGTPEQFLARKERAVASGAKLGVSLTSLSLQAAWSTPRANKWGFPDSHGSHEAPVSGTTSSGSPAGTASSDRPGQLNPAFSAWLMGYSEAWLACAPAKPPKKTR